MNFIKGSLFTVISKAIMFLSSLFISIYIARILGPEAKGMYYLLVQFVSVVVLFGMFGINNSAVYFLGKNKMPQKELYGHLFVLIILSSTILLVFMLLSRNFLLASILKGIPGQYLCVMTFAIPFFMLNQISISIILGLNKIILYNILEIVSYFLLFLNFLIFLVIFRSGLFGAYLGFSITYLLMDCVYAYLFIRNIGLKIKWGKIKEILHYGLRSFLGPICLLLISKLDSFVLNIFSNIREVGFYSIAVSFAELIPFVPLAVGTVLFPKLTSQETVKLDTSVARVIRVMFLFLILLGLAFLIFGRWLILFVYGQTYSPSIIPLYILLPGYIFISLYYLFFSYFNAIAKPEITTFILIITLFVKLFASIFAVSRWGIYGAAVASSISYSLSGLLFLVTFWLRTKKSIRDTFIIKNSDIKYLWANFSSFWSLNKA